MNKIKVNLIGLTVFALFSASTVHSQELLLGVSGGFSGMKYQDSKLSKGSDFSVSLGYAYPIDDNWSVELGGVFGQYSIDIESKSLLGSYNTKDVEGQDFEFRYNASGHNESLKGSYYGIPFRVRYQSEAINNRDTRIYASGGIQYTMYSDVDSDLRVEGITTSGYYPQLDAELHGPNFVGFGTMDDYSETKTMKVKDSFSLLGEVGVKQYFNNGSAVYLGFYATYDLSGSDTGTSHLIEYNSSGEGDPLLIHSSLGAGHEQDDFKLRLFSVGMRLNYAFGF